MVLPDTGGPTNMATGNIAWIIAVSWIDIPICFMWMAKYGTTEWVAIKEIRPRENTTNLNLEEVKRKNVESLQTIVYQVSQGYTYSIKRKAVSYWKVETYSLFLWPLGVSYELS